MEESCFRPRNPLWWWWWWWSWWWWRLVLLAVQPDSRPSPDPLGNLEWRCFVLVVSRVSSKKHRLFRDVLVYTATRFKNNAKFCTKYGYLLLNVRHDTIDKPSSKILRTTLNFRSLEKQVVFCFAFFSAYSDPTQHSFCISLMHPLTRSLSKCTEDLATSVYKNISCIKLLFYVLSKFKLS